MDPPMKVINGKLIYLNQNPNDPAEMILRDDQVPLYDRLLCSRFLKLQRQVSKYASSEKGQEWIEEKFYQLNNKEEEQKIGILKDLNEFKNKIINIRSRIVQQIDEILRNTQLWIADINTLGRKSDTNNFKEDLQLLNQGYQDQLIKSNQFHYERIDSILQKLVISKDDLNCQNILKKILKNRIEQQQNKQKQNKQFNQPITQINSKKDNQLNVKKVELVNTVKQEEVQLATAFNHSGSIMVSGCGKYIQVWNFEKGNLVDQKLLNGHTNWVLCLVFSQKHNWFASGGEDDAIRCWKEDANKDWVSSQPGKSHCNGVYCLILDNKEDHLISCSTDNTIKVWKVNCQTNQLEYDYTLEEKHTDWVYCISLNDSETALVSCGKDKKIILWSKGWFSNKWVYQHELTMNDYGYRICFISDNQIIWQQQCLGITHLLEYKHGKLIKKPDLNLTLNQENNDCSFFPTIRNKKTQVIIQKHNCYVYILKQQVNGQLSIVSEPIVCSNYDNYGSLTQDGEYLTVWTANTQECKVYKIIYG